MASTTDNPLPVEIEDECVVVEKPSAATIDHLAPAPIVLEETFLPRNNSVLSSDSVPANCASTTHTSNASATMHNNNIDSTDATATNDLVNETIGCAAQCSWTGVLHSYPMHKLQCPKVNVVCEWCSVTMAREALQKHLEHKCEERKVVCSECQQGLLAKQLPAHRQYRCVERQVACNIPGCTHRMPYKDFAQHSSNAPWHYDMFNQRIATLEGSNSQVLKANREWKAQHDKLKEVLEYIANERVQLRKLCDTVSRVRRQGSWCQRSLAYPSGTLDGECECGLCMPYLDDCPHLRRTCRLLK